LTLLFTAVEIRPQTSKRAKLETTKRLDDQQTIATVGSQKYNSVQLAGKRKLQFEGQLNAASLDRPRAATKPYPSPKQQKNSRTRRRAES
jgi:hypothetical protein